MSPVRPCPSTGQRVGGRVFRRDAARERLHMSRQHLPAEAGGHPSRPPAREMANPDPSPGAGNEFPDAPSDDDNDSDSDPDPDDES